MAVASFDPVDGHPIFLDTDAPDIKVDPTEAAAYAGREGNRPIGTTAERLAYEYAREGLKWYDTDLDAEFLYSDSTWSLWMSPVKSYTPTLTGFSAGSGAVVGRYTITGGKVDFWVDVTLGSGFGVTGAMYVSVPLTASSAVLSAGSFVALGPGGARVQGVLGFDNTNRVWMLRTDNNFLSNTAWAWASGNRVSIHGSYLVS